MKGLPVPEPSEDAQRSLREHCVPDEVVDIACAMTDCILVAGDDVAADTRVDTFDDATSRGQLLYRRAHNRIIDVFADDGRVVLDTHDNALSVRVGETAISFYSARNGLDSPSLTGSRTKHHVVDEMQLMLDIDGSVPARMVLMHESGEDGTGRVAFGVMLDPSNWNWRVSLFDRYSGAATGALGEHTAYDELPEPELPPIEPHEPNEQDELGGDGNI